MPAPVRSAKLSDRHDRIRSDAALSWYEKGNAHLRRGETDDAIDAYDRALKLRPAFPEALRAGGAILRDGGTNDAALNFFGEAIRLRPTYLDAVLDKGNLLHALGRSDEAVATFDSALVACPNQAGLLTNKGAILHSLGHLDQARAALEAALDADPALPNAHVNYAGYLMRVFRHAEALPVLDRALALKPDYPSAHANRGLTLKMLGRFKEAAEALDRALALEPANDYALTNRGELRLLLGDQARGWIDYQPRFVTQWHNWPLLKSPLPLWAGEPLDGLRVLAITDAGNGDILHFARYVPLLVAAGGAGDGGLPPEVAADPRTGAGRDARGDERRSRRTLRLLGAVLESALRLRHAGGDDAQRRALSLRGAGSGGEMAGSPGCRRLQGRTVLARQPGLAGRSLSLDSHRGLRARSPPCRASA